MEDRELLELAAKAAGCAYDHNTDCLTEDGIDYVQWNPLTDDGDALRLAVKLQLEVQAFDNFSVIRTLGRAEYAVTEKFNGDPYAATRRAIVIAAAEIGKAK